MAAIIAVSAPGVEGKGAAAVQENARVGRGPGWAAAPTGRLATPEEVAKLIAYLASEPARQITGAAIAIDAGNTAG